MAITPTNLPESIAYKQGNYRPDHVEAYAAINRLTAALAATGTETPATLSLSALQESADTAASAGRRLWAAGTITTSSTLTITSDCDLSGLTINYTGTGTAVRVGNPAGTLMRKSIQAPHVIATNKSGTGWGSVAGTIGVQVSNAYACSVTFPRVVGFETGVKVTGVPIGGSIQGTQQCSFYPLHLENNKVNWLVAPFAGANQATSGWANQNSVFGGRFSHNSNEGAQVAGVKHVEFATCPNTVNGWAFFGTSMESPNVVDYHIDMGGQFNTFTQCRFENTGGDASRRVRSFSIARGNMIRGGYESSQLTQVLADTASVFDVDNDRQLTRHGGNATTPTLLLENENSSTAPALTIMAAGAAAAGSDPNTAWCMKATANQWAGKRNTDTDSRLVMDAVNGRLYLGSGSAAAVCYFEGTGTSIRLGGGAHYLPSSDSAQDLGASTLKWRDLRMSRGIGVHGSTPPTAKPTVSGSRADGTALASLLAALASYGLIADSST